jgi:hypothetical protein
MPARAQEAKKATPADGHDIHGLAPHVVESVVMGPYQHYCKAVTDDVLECLIYESTDPKALLVQVEYFIAKSTALSPLPRSPLVFVHLVRAKSDLTSE